MVARALTDSNRFCSGFSFAEITSHKWIFSLATLRSVSGCEGFPPS